MERSFYEVLGVEPTATADDIKKAFRRLASENHPDRNPGDSAKEARFKEVNEAYQTLGDEGKRSVYDADRRRMEDELRRIRDAVAGSGMRSPLDDLFGPNAGTWGDVLRRAQEEAAQRRKERPRQPPVETQSRGDDITTELKLTLAESVLGCKKRVRTRSPRPAAACTSCNGTGSEPGTRRLTCSSCGGVGKTVKIDNNVTRTVACPTCKGRGAISLTPCRACSGNGKMVHEAEITVTVPAGVQEGQQLRLAGQGSPGTPPGDLYLNIEIAPDSAYVRQGKDLYTEVHVPLVTLFRGGHASFPGLDGSEQSVEVPPGTQPGATIVVKGAGIRAAGTYGSLFVKVQLSVPRNLSPRASKLLEELAEEIGESR